MILVLLGTQDKPFTRLLDAIEKSNIKDEVVVQAGCTKYESKKMEIFDYISNDRFDDLVSKCDVLITHAGVGSIMTGLKNGKKVIAAARLKKYNEHTNDHQLQILNNFYESGYILKLEDFDNLDKVMKEVKNFMPKKIQSNTKNIIQLISDYIDAN